MGVYANQCVGSVRHRQQATRDCVHALANYDQVSRTMFSYETQLLLDCVDDVAYEDTDAIVDDYIHFIPARQQALNGVYSTVAYAQLCGSRASQSFGLANTQWSVSDFGDDVFQPLFRLQKPEFWHLYNSLGIDNIFPSVLSNRSRVTPEESFLVWLRRMGSRSTLLEIGHGTFQACPSRLSLIFNQFSDELYTRHSKVASTIGVPVDKMPAFADAVVRKSATGLDNCIAFLDTKATEINRNSDYMQQMANYNGYYGYHCLRWQSLHSPDGITYHLWGPVEGRRSDNYLLCASDYHSMFVGYEEYLGYPVCSYADAGYWCSQYVQTGFRRQNGERRPGTVEDLYSRSMNKCRTCVEWGYGQVRNLFPFTESPGFQRLGSTATGQHYMNATFMTNLITCLRGNITSSFFRLSPPSIEQYLHYVAQ